ncbi:Z1 domain-containing protein [Micromonospora purpureochromogenes]|uniref:Z1 domain-containing protein n=2 Tax=Micromonospora purpureochromogenes TaxID=47872 RepID=A0A1C5A8Z0_9ACTN|nr:Z1 domain-containing protein [Micromonospora purpureochromogenes]
MITAALAALRSGEHMGVVVDLPMVRAAVGPAALGEALIGETEENVDGLIDRLVREAPEQAVGRLLRRAGPMSRRKSKLAELVADDELLDLVAQIARSVYGGGTIEALRRQLGRWVPVDILDHAVLTFENQSGRIRELRDPRSLVDNERLTGRWYAGPQPGDVFWPALQQRLAESGLRDDPLNSINASSTKIVSLLPRPGDAEISARGLVLGHVQSGKTTNFMSVAAKLCDVGYRLVIVLSGITDNLRSQTQQRLERMLVGDAHGRWHLLTGSWSDFDANPRNAANLLGNPEHRLLAVVKKNPYRLRRLAEFLDAAGTVLRDCPVVLIDDEADQASIGVGTRGRQSKINSLIRRILNKPKVAYVAYTATPFANLLIDPSVPDDLYPRDFVVDLPCPEDYFGAETIFGRDLLAHEDGKPDQGLDVIRQVRDDEVPEVQPPRGRDAVDGWYPTMPASLVAALRWFILATAARRHRDGVPTDSTMLIHTSMRAAAHQRLALCVTAHLERLTKDLLQGDRVAWDQLRQDWRTETERLPAAEMGLTPVPWEDVASHVVPVADDIRVVIDNYQSGDRLIYGDAPVTAIAIGGNTLARGLTLEGLVCSYFVRAASAYDTLLQMGRWFGYRPGYQDLPRIWMTSELASWFIDLATVEAEIRQQIRRYEDEHLTPRQLAVKIRKHPALAVTSAAKMRAGITVRNSYSCQVAQTIKFNHRDRDWLDHNISAADRLLQRAAAAPGVTEVTARAGRRALHSVHADEILAFLGDYRFHERSPHLRPEALRDYLRKQNAHGALRAWNVVVIGQERDRVGRMNLGGREVNLINRSRLRTPDAYADIKSLVSTSDRVADLPGTVADIRAQIDGDPTDERLRIFRDGKLGPVGLLCLYPISKDSADETHAKGKYPRVDLQAERHVIGVGLFFPEAWGPEEQDYVSVDLSDIAPPPEEVDVIDIEELDAEDERAGEETPTGRADG